MTIQQKKPIEKLTEAQEAQLPVYAKKWTEIGTDTTPADFNRALAGMKETYKYAKLPEIKFASLCKSPASLVLTFVSCDAYEKGASVESIKNDFFPTLTKLPEGTKEDAFNLLLDFVNHLKATSQPVATKAANGLTVCQTALREFPWQFGYGQHDANWLAFYEFSKTNAA